MGTKKTFAHPTVAHIISYKFLKVGQHLIFQLGAVFSCIEINALFYFAAEDLSTTHEVPYLRNIADKAIFAFLFNIDFQKNTFPEFSVLTYSLNKLYLAN